MEEKDIKKEVLNNFDFSKVVKHMSKHYGSDMDILSEVSVANELIESTLSALDDTGKFEMSKGNYVCIAEKDDGKIVDLLLEYSKTVSSYRYCE